MFASSLDVNPGSGGGMAVFEAGTKGSYDGAAKLSPSVSRGSSVRGRAWPLSRPQPTLSPKP